MQFLLVLPHRQVQISAWPSYQIVSPNALTRQQDWYLMMYINMLSSCQFFIFRFTNCIWIMIICRGSMNPGYFNIQLNTTFPHEFTAKTRIQTVQIQKAISGYLLCHRSQASVELYADHMTMFWVITKIRSVSVLCQCQCPNKAISKVGITCHIFVFVTSNTPLNPYWVHTGYTHIYNTYNIQTH